MTSQEEYDRNVWYVLEKINKGFLYTSDKKPFLYKLYLNVILRERPSPEEERAILSMLKENELIKMERHGDALGDHGLPVAEVYNLTIRPPFNEFYRQHHLKIVKPSTKVKILEKNPIENKYKISVKDRDIWINDYHLSKPYAVGSNFEFFEYVRSKPVGIPIKRIDLPSKLGDLSIQNETKNKSFIKILNGLGFKGQILRAFFIRRSRDSVIYMGDEITKDDLKENGVKIPLFLKELEVAHIKNNSN